MLHTDIKQIQEQLELLQGKPLQRINRAANMIMFGLGDLVKTESAIIKRKYPDRDPTILVPRYALHVQGFWRWIHSNRVILAKNDIYEPADCILENGSYDPDTFEYDKAGNNRCDQIVDERFVPLIENTDNFTVEKISVNNIGDIKIRFDNNFILEIASDITDDKECWRFFETDTDVHMVVGSNEILK